LLSRVDFGEVREIGIRGALGDVVLRHLEDGAVEVANRGQADLVGLTLAVPAAGLAWTVDGAPVAGDADGRRIWFDLPAGERRLVRARRGEAPASLLPPGPGRT